MRMAATSIRADSFVCNLNCYGYFPRAKIFWMGCQDTPVELIHLRDKLGATLENCGYHTDKRIFTPHITLMRKCVEAEHLQANCSLQWPIGEFALVESRSDMHGVNYQLIEKYPFSADKPQNNN
jgi:2'-5' RNA ligase